MYVHCEWKFILVTCKVIEYYSQNYGYSSWEEGLDDMEKLVIVKSKV